MINWERQAAAARPIGSLIAPWWGVKVPRGHSTSSKPAGQNLPRAQGKPGPDEPVAGMTTRAHQRQNEKRYCKFNHHFYIQGFVQILSKISLTVFGSLLYFLESVCQAEMASHEVQFHHKYGYFLLATFPQAGLLLKKHKINKKSVFSSSWLYHHTRNPS